MLSQAIFDRRGVSNNPIKLQRQACQIIVRHLNAMQLPSRVLGSGQGDVSRSGKQGVEQGTRWCKEAHTRQLPGAFL